jgi:hypothetical protein
MRHRLAIAFALLATILAWNAGTASASKRHHGWKGRHHHHGHGGWGGWGWWGPRVVVDVAPGWWWRPVVSLPVVVPFPSHSRVVVEEPLVYVQKTAPPASYWYWCESAEQYYPYVSSCPEPWVPVAPLEDE